MSHARWGIVAPLPCCLPRSPSRSPSRSPLAARVFGLFAALALISAFPFTASAYQHVFELDLRLTTTSDWARFSFDDMQIHVVSRQLNVVGGGYVRSDGGFIAKAGYDTSRVSLQAKLRAIVTGPKPQLVLGKGNAGTTEFTLSSGRNKLVEFRHIGVVPGDDKNQRFVPLDPKVLLDLPGSKLRHHDRLALAFYYGWYGTPRGPTGRWRHWNPGKPHHDSLNVPIGGWYDSLDPAVVTRHCQQAKQAQLDGLILSWWTDHARNQKLLDLLLPACATTDVKLSIYIETVASAKSLRAQLKKLLAGPMQHPAWLRKDGKPVVFLYTRVLGQLSPTALRSAIVGLDLFVVGDTQDPDRWDDFDALHTYYIARKTEAYRGAIRTLRRLSQLSGKPLLATVMPGYDDTNIREPGFVRSREKSAFLRRSFHAAQGADWVLLTSFNEWHEGSEIEPSKQHGDSYLRRFANEVQRWRAGP